jgi:hypothetical protein
MKQPKNRIGFVHPWQVECNRNGKPIYIHTANCTTPCDWTCNGITGYQAARRWKGTPNPRRQSRRHPRKWIPKLAEALLPVVIALLRKLARLLLTIAAIPQNGK